MPSGRPRRATPQGPGRTAAGGALQRPARGGARSESRRAGRTGRRPTRGCPLQARRAARAGPPPAGRESTASARPLRGGASRRGSADTRRSGAGPGCRRPAESSNQQRRCPESVTAPMTASSSSHFPQTAETASSCSGAQTPTIRSWLSEIMISQGSIPASRSGTRSRWTSTPAPPSRPSRRATTRALQRRSPAATRRGPPRRARDLPRSASCP